MKCNKCGSEWNSTIKSTICPFCGKTIIEVPKTERVEDVLKVIVDTYGVDIYNKPSILVGALSDYLPRAIDERRLIKLCLDTGIMKTLLNMGENDDIIFTQKKVSKELQEHCFLNEIMADKCVYWISFSLGIIGKDNNKVNKDINSEVIKNNNDVSDTNNIKQSENKMGTVLLNKNVNNETNNKSKILPHSCDNYIGKRIDGRYEIMGIISVEKYSVVYAGRDVIDNKNVTVNVLNDELLMNEKFKMVFKNEIKAVAILSHSNIPKLFDVCFGDRMHYIVSEYLVGISLKEFLLKSTLELNEILHLVEKILGALQYAHDKGILHGNISPQNVILKKDGEVKIINFGLAKAFSVIDKEYEYNPYINPQKDKLGFIQTDIYCVGCMLKNMLIESTVGLGDGTETFDSLQTGIKQIILKATESNYLNRYSTVKEMLDDILAYKKNPNIVFRHDVIKSDMNSAAEIYAAERKSREWQSKGVCQFCGGDFKGLLVKKCEKCGKKKSY